MPRLSCAGDTLIADEVAPDLEHDHPAGACQGAVCDAENEAPAGTPSSDAGFESGNEAGAEETHFTDDEEEGNEETAQILASWLEAMADKDLRDEISFCEGTNTTAFHAHNCAEAAMWDEFAAAAEGLVDPDEEMELTDDAPDIREMAIDDPYLQLNPGDPIFYGDTAPDAPTVGAARFEVVETTKGKIVRPREWFYYFGLKDTIERWMRDPEFCEARARRTARQQPDFWTSEVAKAIDKQ
eukprot:gene23361-28276_t